MSISDFIVLFADEFESLTSQDLSPETIYKDLDEWSSLTALGIMAMVKIHFKKSITGLEVRTCRTIQDLFNLIESK